MNKQTRAVERQKGIVSIFMAFALAVITLIAGLGVDLGHAYVNKTKAQTLVDSLALTGAKTLDSVNDTVRATSDINQLFADNMSRRGYERFNEKISQADLTIQYSNTLYPFTAGGAGPYVRVAINSVSFDTWLIRATGLFDTLEINASAVAGPSNGFNNLCNAAPVIACGDTSDDPSDPDHSGDSFWGYTTGQIQVLKHGSGGGNNNAVSCIGPGNYQLARLGGNGGDVVRHGLAGNSAGCFYDPEFVDTEPGVTTGPVTQGLNTRFGEYQGAGMNPTDYPPDLVVEPLTQEIDVQVGADGCVTSTSIIDDGTEIYDYDWYKNRSTNPADTGVADTSLHQTGGIEDRRLLRVPVADCTGINNGQSSLPFLGTACFFILKPVVQKGNENEIYGEFVNQCNAEGSFGLDPSTGPGTRIVLHDDPLRQDA